MPTPISTRPEPRSSRGRLAAWGVVVLTVATILLGALLPGRHVGALPPAGDAGRPAAGETVCLEWTDGCRVCRRLPDGPACSLPGIACQPGAERCLRRSGG